MPRKYGSCLSGMPSTLPVSSDVQVVKSGPLSYHCWTHLDVCFILQVPIEIILVPLLHPEELFITGYLYFSLWMYLLQEAFISLTRKSLAKKTLFILCSEYSSYFATHIGAYAGLSLARRLLSSFIIRSPK